MRTKAGNYFVSKNNKYWNVDDRNELESNCDRQADVSHHSSVFLRRGPGLQVHRADGHRPGGQQAVPVRIPPLLLAGGREGRPASAREVHT